MTFEEHRDNEKRNALNREWKYLSEWQRNLIFLRFVADTLPRRVLNALDQYINRRRARFAYLYPAHWIRFYK